MLVLALFLCRFNLLHNQLSLKGTPLGLALSVHLRRDVHFIKSRDHFTFLGNCPPTSPLNYH